MKKVIVTGAEEHQGLAVIRGLGLAGIPVVACGSRKNSLGFYSRFATEHYCYTSPFEDAKRFVEDILAIVSRSGAELIIPVIESTLVALDEHRGELEGKCVLAAPPSEVLEFALDKWKTVNLAQKLRVPVPRTLLAVHPAEMDREADRLKYPIALKPRGNAMYSKTANQLGFKVQYADTPARLCEIVHALPPSAGNVLIQEFVAGAGTCVAAIYDHGHPIVHFPYVRVREVPITGGISVVRKSIPLDNRLRHYVHLLLGRLGWHGIAMVEFKNDAPNADYILMEINGRFMGSTALSLDAGLNLPFMVYSLFTGGKLEDHYEYKPATCERWLRGDWLSLIDYLSGKTLRAAVRTGPVALPSRRRVLLDFVMDFGSRMHYDEFKRWDWRPGVVETLALVWLTLKRVRDLAGDIGCRWRTRVRHRDAVGRK